ncbi:MAG: hypothetical protein RIC19_02615 [Phaeodactylibacter sp.]|uniref:hypothetical protein n=1 Tax=Phaeodactylibacter sp. TaxID=1940289 RepID=UPI0032EB6477
MKHIAWLFLSICALSQTTSLSAQDTLITTSNDTLLVRIEGLEKDKLFYRTFEDSSQKQHVSLTQVARVLYQDKQQNQDFSNSGETTLFNPADTSRLTLVTTIDGNEYVGKILEQTTGTIKLETAVLGIISIPRQNIKSIQPVSGNLSFNNGEIWRSNPQSTRYLWSPNGFGLKPGEGYYQNILILFNQVSVGVTDHFSMSLGTVPLFLFAGAPTPVWIVPKFSIPVKKDKFNIGGGALIGTVLGDTGTDNNGFGIAFGVGTIGNRDRNLTLGLGYGYAGQGWANAPTITISGMYRIGEKGYLITENVIVGTATNSPIGFLSFGGRTVWPKVALDYGGYIPANTGDGNLFVIPWLGLSVLFGQ